MCVRSALAIVLLASVAGAAEAAVPPSERGALLALYRSTGGDHWIKKTGWMRADRHEADKAGTECSWFGVTCDGEESHVTELSLAGNNLVGRLPPHIRAFTRLEVLTLRHNRLVGRIPPSLWTLTRLTRIDLSGNRFGGAISTEVGRLRRLEQLALDDNFLTGSIPVAVGDCLELKSLSLARNGLRGAPPLALGNLRQLDRLDLSSNRLEGPLPATWGGLKALQELRVEGNRLTGAIPDSWARLEHLGTLTAADNDLTGPLPQWIFSLPALRICDVSRNRLSGEWRLPSRVATSLEILRVSHNALVGSLPEALDQLTDLEEIDISHNDFGGDLPTVAFAVKTLRAAGNRFTGRLEQVETLPETTDLSDNLLTGPINPDIDASHVGWLSLARNRLAGPIPADLLGCDARSLDLSGNQFAGGLPPDWQPSKHLRMVNLSNNGLSGPVPARLFGGEGLLWVDLSGNRLSGSLPPVTHARALQVLKIAGNELTGVLPVSQEATPWLAWLSVEHNRLTGGLAGVATLQSLIAFDGTGNPWVDAQEADRARSLPRHPPAHFAAVDDFYLLEHAKAAPPAEPPPIQLPPERPLTVAGVVVDPMRSVIPGATIRVLGSSGPPLEALTEPDGTFRVMVPAPGTYAVTCEVVGFATSRKTVVVAPEKGASLEMSVSVASVSEQVEVSSEGRSAVRGLWNTWISERDKEAEPPDYLAAYRSYQYVLELGGGDERRAIRTSVPIDARLADYLGSQLRGGKPTVSLVVRFAVVGRSLRIADPARVEEWDGDGWRSARGHAHEARLALDLRRMAAASESPPLQNDLGESYGRYGAIRLDVNSQVEGCAAIASSIWSEDGTIPLDQIVDVVAVGRATVCERYRGGGTEPASAALGFDRSGSNIGAGLQVFEFMLGGRPDPTAIAILALKEPQPECGAFMWQLNGSLSATMLRNTTFLDLLATARKRDYEAKKAYADIADLVRRLVFAGVDLVPGCGGRAALNALRQAAENSDVDLLMRSIGVDGDHLFPPLGLLSLAEDAAGIPLFKHGIVPIEALPAQSARDAECVGDWVFVLPDALLQEAPLPAGLPRPAIIRNGPDLARFLDERRSPRRMGLVLLAHHEQGYLGFEQVFRTDMKKVSATELTYEGFGPGSIAVLSACATAAITNTSILLDRLTRAGVDSFVMSPFEIDVQFGRVLAANIADAIVNTPARKEGRVTLRELFGVSMKKTVEHLQSVLPQHGDSVAGWARELVLAGNPDVGVCFTPRPPQ